MFSRLAALCAERIARAKPASESFRSVYRAVDHGHTLNALRGHPEFGLPLGDNFKRLQEARNWADYRVDPHPESDKGASGRFTREEAQQLVALARDSIEFVDALAPDARQRLAVLLVARSRR